MITAQLDRKTTGIIHLTVFLSYEAVCLLLINIIIRYYKCQVKYFRFVEEARRLKKSHGDMTRG